MSWQMVLKGRNKDIYSLVFVNKAYILKSSKVILVRNSESSQKGRSFS